MSPMVFSLVCPHCGGTLDLTARADIFRCQHCGNLAVLRWTAAAAPPETTRLVEREKWAANLLRPGSSANWQGGALILSDRELAFVPHGFNFGSLDRAVLPLQDLVDLSLKKGLISDELTLTGRDGERWGVRVWKGAAVLEAIEQARSARA